MTRIGGCAMTPRLILPLSLVPHALPDPDALLVRRTVEGDLRAYDQLVIRYQRRIERLISRLVRDSDLVEDIAQETFLRAFRALPRFRGEARFYTWLYRIAVNTARKALLVLRRDLLITETALRANDPEDEGGMGAPGETEPSGDETPETALAAKEVAAALNQAMAILPEDLRQAVILREIEGLSYEEIAHCMHCPIGTVRSRIFRAREAISVRVRPLLANQTGKRW